MVLWVFVHSLLSGPKQEEDKHNCYSEVDKQISILPLSFISRLHEVLISLQEESRDVCMGRGGAFLLAAYGQRRLQSHDWSSIGTQHCEGVTARRRELLYKNIEKRKKKMGRRGKMGVALNNG